jgi:hypothetical protein
MMGAEYMPLQGGQPCLGTTFVPQGPASGKNGSFPREQSAFPTDAADDRRPHRGSSASAEEERMETRLSVVGKTWASILALLALGALTGFVSARQASILPETPPESVEAVAVRPAADSIPSPPGPLPPRMMYQR